MNSDSESPSITIDRNTSPYNVNVLSLTLNSIGFSKFTVFNGASFPREQILSSVLKQVSPNYLLPFEYEVDKSGNSHFLSSTCWHAIKNLASNKMMVNIPDINVQLEVKVSLYFKYPKDYKIIPLDALQIIIRKRVSTISLSTNSLDLSNLENDEVFSGPSNLYFSLGVPQFQCLLVKSLWPVTSLRSLTLSHNKISSLIAFSKIYCPKMEEINLSHNEITWSDMIPILPNKVKSVWLDGNPLCSSPLSEYIKNIKELYPLLEQLDGYTIYPEVDAPYIMKNSFVNISSHQLVDQFLHHYFNWFSKLENRISMISMYHHNASLSVSCNIPPGSENAFHDFQYLSRNILKLSNYGKTVDSFQTGTNYISYILGSLPYLELDPSTATVDVPYYIDKKVIVISMAGVFKHKFNSMYWICFTFILQASTDTLLKEWKIINQMINISLASSEQTKVAFSENMKKIDVKKFDLDRSEILSQFKELTCLKTVHCEHFLDSKSWDLESALQSFVDQHKGDLIPDDAFVQS